MACCCGQQYTNCEQCCSPYPSEVMVSLASDTQEVCYACIGSSGGSGFPCARLGNFSLGGSYTLAYVGSCTYIHQSCASGTFTRIVAAIEIVNGQCVWFFTGRVRKSLGTTNSLASACRNCNDVATFLAEVYFQGQFSMPAVCSGVGGSSATGGDGFGGGMGFDGAKCSLNNVVCLPVGQCVSGSDTYAGDCVPKTLSVTATLSV